MFNSSATFNDSPVFCGSYVALITPFRNGKIDEPALRKLVNWQIQQGTNGLVTMGTTGEDITALAYNVAGGTGCISVTANVAPVLCAKFQAYCAAGNFAAARKIHDLLAPLHLALFAEPNPAGIKYAASLLELCSEECRLPMVALSANTKSSIKQALKPVVH